MRKALIIAVALWAVAHAASAQTVAILIFGGIDHKEFLGCLNCSQYDANSVWNDYSQYGWGNSYGKWNHYGSYASPYAAQSACNEYSSDAPVMVDKDGNYYGRLSVSQYSQGSVCGGAGVERVCTALKVMCADK